MKQVVHRGQAAACLSVLAGHEDTRAPACAGALRTDDLRQARAQQPLHSTTTFAGSLRRLAAAIAWRTYTAWRRRRHARATCLSLGELDDATLRDLGLARAEILSVACELAGRADAIRVRSRASLARDAPMRGGL